MRHYFVYIFWMKDPDAELKNCKDMDEVIKLANEENIELTDDQLEFLASGGCSCEGCYGKACTRLHQVCQGWD